ncbi:hypothetical protein QQ045_023645 [Rhodiola kirilowii]
MSNKSPVFPMPEPHHFSDYGFDPQFDYFQVLEETRNQEREASSRSIDSIRFKLQKPNSDDVIRTPQKKKTKKKRRWWSKAFMMCFNFNWSTKSRFNNNDCNDNENRDVHMARAQAFRSSAAHRMLRSQPLLSPGSGCNSPYLSLRELNVEQQHLRRMSGSASPIYFVT